MAFLKKEKKSSGTYLRIVESYRDKAGKSQHRTIYKLGKAENYSKRTLKRIGEIFLELSGEDNKKKTTKDLEELSRKNYGFQLVYDKIMKYYELDKILLNIEKRQNLSYDLYKHVLLMLIERLNEPSSKLSNYNHQSEYIGFEDIKLHNLYRALDHLSENQKQIQETIYSKGRHLFNQKLDVVFYDVTTIYFDSEQEDGFRMQGFSKDGKIGKSVIVFGMLIDKDKNPVGYNIYRGGFYEGHTFKDALKKLKEEYEIEKVITVADTGMMNKENIELIEDIEGYEYIIGERLKNLPKAIQGKILDRSKYKTMEIKEEQSGEVINLDYMVIEYKGKRIITTYSSKRAAKDRYDREQRIAKGKLMTEKQWELEKKARRNYLKNRGNNNYEIDKEKIARDELFDGLACIATNNTEMEPAEILSAYKHLYKIEQTFRTFKSYLETRPMFHWTQKRIEGHLSLCYMAFTMLNYLGNKLRKNGIKLSENKIRRSLSNMQLSLIESREDKFYLRSHLNEEMKSILRTLKIKQAPNYIENNSLSQYIPTI